MADADDPEIYELAISLAQRRLWFLAQLEPESAAYHMSAGVRIAGALDGDALARSLDDLAMRHEVLRTGFAVADGEPVQQIHARGSLTLRRFDLRAQPASEHAAAVRRIAAADAARPFELARPGLARASLVTLGEHDHQLFVTFHHLICDDWSIGVFIAELVERYTAAAAGRAYDAPALTIQYGDWAEWQRKRLTGDRLARLRTYWRDRLAGAPALLALPTDVPRPVERRAAGGRVPVRIPRPLATALGALANSRDATPFMALLAAFQALLARYAGESDIVVGTPVANRGRAETEGLIGLFVDTLAIRVDLSGAPSFDALLGRVRASVLGAFAHHELPFDDVVATVQPPRSRAHTPIFQAMFVLANAPRAPLAMAGVTFAPVPVDGVAAQVDLALALAEVDDGLAGHLTYAADLFEPASASRIARHFEILVAGCVASPDTPVARIALLDAAERDTVIARFNPTAARDPGPRTLPAAIAAQAARTPSAPAVELGAEVVCYAELDARANRVAHHLQAQGVGPEVLVGVHLERSIELIVALVAILKAGGAFVPLDPSYPAERLAMMLADARPAVVISDAGMPALPCARLVCLDLERAAIAACPATPPVDRLDARGLAYVIFTSGSTGRPKGAMNSHEAICNRLSWMQDTYRLDGSDRVLQKTPCGFDVSVWELFWPLITGATLVMAPPRIHQDAAALVELVAAGRITTLHFVPSMLGAMLEQAGLERWGQVRRVICSGEALSRELAVRWMRRVPAGLHNLYGPTEAAVDVTAHACQASERARPVPIGAPIANTRIYVLDDHLDPQPLGVAGELYIGGLAVGRGYHDRPALTAERFVPDPYAVDAGTRMYRTGDRARWRPDGELEFLGRRDHQVKIRGVRIELGEVEEAVRACPEVGEAAVLARPDPRGELQLVAYVTLAAAFDEDAVRRRLRAHLPEQLIPAVFVTLAALPTTLHGKLDRDALPAPGATRGRGARVAPRGADEERMVALWADVLAIAEVGMTDDFFALGGHSILAVRLLARVREAFGIEVPLRALFEDASPRGLLAVLRGGRASAGVDLRAEAVLDPALRFAAAAPTSFEGAHVLLTGASGFLGGFLLHELLRAGVARVSCLVRAPDAGEAIRRIEGTLRRHGLWSARDAERIVPVLGDLGAPGLGLAAIERAALSASLDAIFHNGAEVNFVYPYARLRAANVGGTEAVLRLAAGGRAVPVHYVSTISVLEAAAPELTRIDERCVLEHPERLSAGYAQTKWVAERLVRAAARRGLPAVIYRPGTLTGRSSDGAWPVGDFLSRVMLACLRHGVAPRLDLSIDMTPVDFAARAIVGLAAQPDSVGQVFHLCNPEPVPLEALARRLGALGYPVELVALAPWQAAMRAAAAADDRHPLHPLLPLLDQAAGDDAPAPVIEGARTAAALGSALRCPAIDDPLLDRYARHLLGR